MLISETKASFFNRYKYTAARVQHYSSGADLHDRFAFIFLQSGACRLSVNGYDLRLNEGDAYLLPPWHLHTIDGSEAEALLLLTFSDACIPCAGEYQFSVGDPPYRADETILKIIGETLVDAECKDPFLLLSCLNLLMSDHLSHQQKERSAEATKGENDLVPRALAYMKAHFSEQLTLSALAKNIGSNASYLSRLLNENNGLGFSGYLNVFRFSHAEVLLRSTDKPIWEIAADCGFGSVRSFNRIFIQRYNKTPTEMRKQEQETAGNGRLHDPV